MLTAHPKAWHLPVPDRNAGALRAAATRIVSERQFQRPPSLVQQLVNWLSRHLDLPDVKLPVILGGAWQSYLALALMLVGAVVVVVVAMRRGLWRRLRSPTGSPGVVVTQAVPQYMTPVRWREEAERLASEGRYREAMRCRYRSLVGELAQRGMLDEVPGRTSGDYQRLVSALLPEVAERFTSVSDLFERCWYGHEPSDARAQAAFDDASTAIVAQVDSRPSKARAQ